MTVYHTTENSNENAYSVLDDAYPTSHFYTIKEIGFGMRWRVEGNALHYICDTLHSDAVSVNGVYNTCGYTAPPQPAPAPKPVCATDYIADVYGNCVPICPNGQVVFTDVATGAKKCLPPVSSQPVASPSQPSAPTGSPTKPPVEGTPETYYSTLTNGYKLYSAGNQYHLYRPDGTSLGFYQTPQQAQAGVDGDIQTMNPIPAAQPTAPTPQQAPTGTQAVKYTCKNGNDIFIDPAILRTGINPEDLCGAVNLPAPGQPLTPEQQKAQDAIDAAKAVAKANSGQQLTPPEQQAVNKYFTIPPTAQTKDNTGLYIALGAGALALALLFGGKK